MSDKKPWKPVWVERLDNEIAGYEKERQKHHEMVHQYDTKIEELMDKRKTWTERDAE